MPPGIVGIAEESLTGPVRMLARPSGSKENAKDDQHAALAQSVERVLGKDEVLGSKSQRQLWILGAWTRHQGVKSVGTGGFRPGLPE